MTALATLLASSGSGKVPGADIEVELWMWVAFLALITFLLLADLFLFHREAHEISMREAAITSVFWIVLGVSFSLVIWALLGGAAASQYLTGYVIEKSLSVDNVFVWAVILSYFAVPKAYQHRVLFWGVFGALVLRAIFIFAGVALLEAFDWMLFVFGGFLIFTAYRVARHDNTEIHPERNPVLRIMRRFVPVTSEYHGQRFWVRIDARRLATPLLVVLVLVEATDVVFAVDSIPAILAVTRSQFLVFTSNAFAILGLRALYFLLAGAAGKLRYLNIGLGVILAYVGVKMIVSEWYHVPTFLSLGVIAVVLAVTVWVSLRADARERGTEAPEAPKP
ncbi:MAG: tellurium resistance protein TerC [Acidimicrobiia bacterium]